MESTEISTEGIVPKKYDGVNNRESTELIDRNTTERGQW